MASEAQLNVAESMLNENEKEVNQAIAAIESQTGQSFDTVYGEVVTAYYSYITVQNQLDEAGAAIVNPTVQARITQLENEKTANAARINAISNIEIPALDMQIAEKQQQINALDINSASYVDDLETLQGELNELQAQKIELQSEAQLLTIRNEAINTIISTLNAQQSGDAVAALENVLNEADQLFIGYGFAGVEDAYMQLTQLNNARSQIETARNEIASGRASVASGRQQIESAKAEIEANRQKYTAAVREYEEGVLKFDQEIEKAEALI